MNADKIVNTIHTSQLQASDKRRRMIDAVERSRQVKQRAVLRVDIVTSLSLNDIIKNEDVCI